MREKILKRKRHGMSKSPEYLAWRSMKSRCFRKKNASYKNYGGRGITVCKKWKNNFEAFLSDMGRRPSPLLSLDRINNELGYFPENCKWATKKEQALNRRQNLKRKPGFGSGPKPKYILMADGSFLTIREISKKFKLEKQTLYVRLRKGEDISKLIRPSRQKKNFSQEFE